MSQFEEIEPQGILVNSEFKVITTLEKKKAYNEKSAAELMDVATLLDILEKSGIIGKTAGGKYFITKKGRQKQFKGFKIARK